MGIAAKQHPLYNGAMNNRRNINNWRNIIGHDWAVELLTAALRYDRIGHAYLITGPGQIGKTTLARTFAQALNCRATGVDERPCGQCRACTLIAADRYPDVRLVQPDVSDRGKALLKIDSIRSLQQDLNLTASEGRYKVAILKQFDSANSSAANAFLKTLEEPPRNVILLLTAGDADTLLPTIQSRCRTIALRPLPATLIEQSLPALVEVSSEEAYLLAHLANGRLGWAVRAAREPAILAGRATQLEQLYDALAGNRVTRFALADKLSQKGELLPELLQTWLSWWRDLVLLKNGDGAVGRLTNVDQRARLQRLAQRIEPQQALASLKQTSQAIWQIEHNANSRLVVENLLLVYPR